MPFNMKPWEFLLIVALILLLFGAKRLPDAARGLGRSLRIFKAETKAMHDDDAGPGDVGETSAPAAPPAISQNTAASAPEQQQPSTTPAPERTET